METQYNAGSYYNAVVVSWQGAALMRKHPNQLHTTGRKVNMRMLRSARQQQHKNRFVTEKRKTNRYITHIIPFSILHSSKFFGQYDHLRK